MNFYSFKFASFTLVTYLIINIQVQAQEKAEDCIVPNKKAISELVDSTKKPIAMAVSMTSDPVRESYQDAFCMQFEAAEDTVDVETIFEKMEASPYASSLKDFWSTPACHSPRKNDSTVPILFNTATTVFRSEKFPQVVHDYFVTEKKDPQAWLNAINTKTSDGLTFLDFLQYSLEKGNYDSKPTGDAARKIVSYLCQNGGVYSKYRATAKCP